MLRYCSTLIVLFFCALVASAQRHGRADAIQNYMGPKSPQLLLQVKVQGKRLYFRPAELRKMQRSVATFTDAATGTTHTYEGVNFESLIPNMGSRSESENIEVSFGSHQTMTILGADLDPSSKPMVVDTVDGKQITGYVPYYFIAKTRRDSAVPIKNVKLLSVKASP